VKARSVLWQVMASKAFPIRKSWSAHINIALCVDTVDHVLLNACSPCALWPASPELHVSTSYPYKLGHLQLEVAGRALYIKGRPLSKGLYILHRQLLVGLGE
jgi:hypothetical protein